jgi:hypothetical protein
MGVGHRSRFAGLDVLLGRRAPDVDAGNALIYANRQRFVSVTGSAVLSDVRKRRRDAEQRDELAAFHCSGTSRASVKGLNSLRLRRGLPCHKLPSLRSLGPDVEEFEPEAARLPVNLGLDCGPACDKRGIADHAHLTFGKASALILGLARSHRFEPARLGVGDGGGVGVEKPIVCKPLHSLPVSSNHRRKALVF